MSETPDIASPSRTELWRLQQLALVSQVATQVTSISDLEELLLRVVGLIYQTFEFYVVSLYTLDKEVLVLRAQAGPAGSFKVEDAFIPREQMAISLGDGIIGWVGQHGQELVVSDVSRERRFLYSAEAPRTQAEAALPLKVEDTLLGVLDVQVDYPEDFAEDDMLVLRALAGQVSMAIEDTRLYAEARRRGDYLATISEVSWAIGSILDVDQLLEQVCELIRKYFGYPFVQVFTINYGRRQIVSRAGSGARAEARKRREPLVYSLDDTEGIIPLVARTGKTIRADDVTTAPAYRLAEILPLATKSELTIPLIYNDGVLGVLDVQSDQVAAFSDDDQVTMETLAANIAVALRNANLYQTERWRHQVAESLRRISGALITDVDLNSILDTILVELKRSLPVDIMAVWLLRNKKLQPGIVCTPADPDFEPDFEPDLDPWLATGLKALEPLQRQDHHPADPIAAQLGFAPDHSAIVAPLRVQNRVLGLLTLAAGRPRQYGQEAMLIATAFANQTAIALENARLFKLAQEEAQINSALLKVAQAAQGFDPLSDVLTAVTQIPPLVAEVDRCAIWLEADTPGVYEPEAAHGFSPATLAFFQQYAIDEVRVVAAGRLNQLRAPIVVVDAMRDERLPVELVAGLNLHTLILLPLIAHDEMLGLMLVTFTSTAVIRDDVIRLITGIAHQAAVAIESKYLYERKAQQERMARELELARAIQAGLIPSDLPAPEGWEVAAAWVSMQEVGGDFYDFIQVTPTHLGIVIADVAGKGMPAALYMVLARSLLRAIAPGQTDPRAVLRRTNELLLPDTRRGMFVTLFYGLLDTVTGRLTYSNAGHNPPVLVTANGQTALLRGRGVVLGVQVEIEPEVEVCQLEPGDGVVLYTDGVVEVTDSATNFFGLERLQCLLEANWQHGPALVVETVRQAVNNFSATESPTDDLTLLVLRRK